MENETLRTTPAGSIIQTAPYTAEMLARDLESLPAPSIPLAETDPKVTYFAQTLEKLCNDHLRQHFAILAERQRIAITLEAGPKFIRVVRSEVALGKEDGPAYGSRSVHCFIDRSNGNILKPAGWKGPEKKNPRGNLSDPNPLAGVTVYGVVYLR